MKLLIGIISYLPNDVKIREERFKTLRNLIATCNYLFHVDIYIVTQNFTETEKLYLKGYNNVYLSEDYIRLGIVGARKKLREYFINSTYTNIIMLDDDCIIQGSPSQAVNYIKQIEENRDCFIEFNDSLLKLFCISKELLKEVDYPDISVENAEGFEDRIFVNELRKRFSDKRRIFKYCGIEELSTSTKDVLSTWYKNQDIKEMLEKTNKINAKLNE